MALSATGNVYAWGRNEDGKLGLGDTQNRTEPTLIPGLPKISKIFCGGHHSMALSREKKLYGWGWNYHGNLALGPGQDTLSPVFMMEGIEDVATGWSHMFAFLEEGGGGSWRAPEEDKWVEIGKVEGGARVLAWGFGDYGQLGQHDSADKKTPIVFRLEQKGRREGGYEDEEERREVEGSIEAIIANGYQTHIVTSEGSLWAFGHGANGRLGIGDAEGGNVLSPTRVAGNWEVPWGRQRKWTEVMRWLFLGRLERGSEFSGLPTEVLFHVVGVLMR
jgi:alpha-tubulin suppressor-like RCC1 family protein